MSSGVPEPVDRMMGPETTVLLRQRRSHVRHILHRLPSKDRALLEQIFLEERDKDEVFAGLFRSIPMGGALGLKVLVALNVKLGVGLLVRLPGKRPFPQQRREPGTPASV